MKSALVSSKAPDVHDGVNEMSRSSVWMYPGTLAYDLHTINVSEIESTALDISGTPSPPIMSEMLRSGKAVGEVMPRDAKASPLPIPVVHGVSP